MLEMWSDLVYGRGSTHFRPTNASHGGIHKKMPTRIKCYVCETGCSTCRQTMFVYKFNRILYAGDEIGLAAVVAAEIWDAQLKGEKRLPRLASGNPADKVAG